MLKEQTFNFRGFTAFLAAAMILPFLGTTFALHALKISFDQLFPIVSTGMVVGGWFLFMWLGFSGIIPEKNEPIKMHIVVYATTPLLAWLWYAFSGNDLSLYVLIGLLSVLPLFLAPLATSGMVAEGAPTAYEAHLLFFLFGFAAIGLAAFAEPIHSWTLGLGAAASLASMFLYGWFRFDRYRPVQAPA